MTGIGLFLEGYVIFSISNVTVLFNQSHGYYNCFKTYTSCNKVCSLPCMMHALILPGINQHAQAVRTVPRQ